MKILWIGTGVMGSNMIKHLLPFHQVTAFNRRIEKATSIDPRLEVTTNLVDAINHQDMILTMLGTPADVKEIHTLLIREGKPTTTLIDFTTSSPDLAATLYQQAKAKDMNLLDAPVTGGKKGAIEKSLTIMVGGDRPVYEAALPLFNILGKNIFYMGKAGMGQHAKMANQIAIAGQLVGLAEALSYATEKNLDLTQVLAILSSGAASSYSVTHYGPKMLEKDWSATFYLKHFLKDLSIALANSLQPLPVVEQVKKTLTSLVDRYGEQGVQSIIQAYLK
jgi:3-hydroxyisobutyrate dehydrogenase-like beta-hydroxyacid dehydrogenase